MFDCRSCGMWIIVIPVSSSLYTVDVISLYSVTGVYRIKPTFHLLRYDTTCCQALAFWHRKQIVTCCVALLGSTRDTLVTMSATRTAHVNLTISRSCS